MSSVAKIGPWGNNSKARINCDITVAPLRLESITVRHGWVVEALSFSYRDHEKLQRSAGPWGSYHGSSMAPGDLTTITLRPSEFVTDVQGEYGEYMNAGGIANLTIVTNLRSYGPFGDAKKLENKESFSVPVKDNGSIVGFFAVTSNEYVSGLGVYVKPL